MYSVRTSTYWYGILKVRTFSLKYVLLSCFLYSVRTRYILFVQVRTEYVLGEKSTYEYVLGGKSTYSNGAVQVSMIRYLSTSRYVPGCTQYVLRFTIPDAGLRACDSESFG